MTKLCKDCRYFKVSGVQHTGNCRRFPPSFPSDDWTAANWGTDRRWPIVSSTDSCGEWKPKETA